MEAALEHDVWKNYAPEPGLRRARKPIDRYAHPKRRGKTPHALEGSTADQHQVRRRPRERRRRRRPDRPPLLVTELGAHELPHVAEDHVEAAVRTQRVHLTF